MKGKSLQAPSEHLTFFGQKIFLTGMTRRVRIKTADKAGLNGGVQIRFPEAFTIFQ